MIYKILDTISEKTLVLLYKLSDRIEMYRNKRRMGMIRVVSDLHADDEQERFSWHIR